MRLGEVIGTYPYPYEVSNGIIRVGQPRGLVERDVDDDVMSEDPRLEMPRRSKYGPKLLRDVIGDEVKTEEPETTAEMIRQRRWKMTGNLGEYEPWLYL